MNTEKPGGGGPRRRIACPGCSTDPSLLLLGARGSPPPGRHYLHDRGPGTGDRGPGTGDRGPGTGDRGPGTGDREENYLGGAAFRIGPSQRC